MTNQNLSLTSEEKLDSNNCTFLLIRHPKQKSQVGLVGSLILLDHEHKISYLIGDTCENAQVGVAANKDLAIPLGKYNMNFYSSNRFKNACTDDRFVRVWNELVPEDRCIAVHAGNTHRDTEGCILLGQYIPESDEFINSRITVDSFYRLLTRFKFYDDAQYELCIVDHDSNEHSCFMSNIIEYAKVKLK